jgi:hypothetical protein
MSSFSLEQRALLEDALAWHLGTYENFATRLFALVDEADRPNRAKIGVAYPEYLWAYEYLVREGVEAVQHIINEVN